MTIEHGHIGSGSGNGGSGIEETEIIFSLYYPHCTSLYYNLK